MHTWYKKSLFSLWYNLQVPVNSFITTSPSYLKETGKQSDKEVPWENSKNVILNILRWIKIIYMVQSVSAKVIKNKRWHVNNVVRTQSPEGRCRCLCRVFCLQKNHLHRYSCRHYQSLPIRHDRETCDAPILLQTWIKTHKSIKKWKLSKQGNQITNIHAWLRIFMYT